MQPSSHKHKPPGQPKILVHAEILQGSLEAASELDVDLSEILEAHQIDASLLKSPSGFLESWQVCGVLESVADQFNCPHFGFLVGKHQFPLSFGPGRQLLRLSPTLLQAARNMEDFIDIYTYTSRYELDINGEYAIVRRFDRHPGVINSAQLCTLGVMQLYKACREFCGQRWNLSAMHFRHAAPPQAALYARYVGCPVRFNSDFDGICLPKHLLHLENEASDPELYAIVLAHCERLREQKRKSEHDDIQSQIRIFIRQSLGSKECNLETFCESKDISKRTLQRQLAYRGNTFRGLLNEERMQIAREYLARSKISLTELSHRLGYESLSNFSRAFSVAHGNPPQSWRRKHSPGVSRRKAK